MERVDAVVIGAGVVGLAVARAMALRGLETIVLERAGSVGTGTSSRNSEVVHAGIHGAVGSLKARLCVQGRGALCTYAESRGVGFRRCGKLIVASTPAQAAALAAIEAQARRHGVADLQRLDAAGVRALEPALRAVAALLSPSTGIIDSHALMLALQGDLERAGGVVALNSPVAAVACGRAEHVVHTAAPFELAARWVVNAAGLWAPSVAAATIGLAPHHVPVARYAKGNYAALTVRAPFSRLVYPVPEASGLGVHLTLALDGQARFGPDVEWITPASPDDIDYRVDPARLASFDAAIRAYWPGLPDGVLQPAYSGVRPKLHGPGQAPADFMLQGPADHGIAGLMNLFGIESPGLTASLAIADEVISRLGLPGLQRRV